MLFRFRSRGESAPEITTGKYFRLQQCGYRMDILQLEKMASELFLTENIPGLKPNFDVKQSRRDSFTSTLDELVSRKGKFHLSTNLHIGVFGQDFSSKQKK